MPVQSSSPNRTRSPNFRRNSSPHTAPSSSPRAPRRRANTDTVKLLMLGYRQELAREFTLFNCFGSSLNALSTMASLSGTYGIGMSFTYGGPVVMMWGLVVVMVFSSSMGLSMAELASAYPTSGALYYWSFRLAPPRLRTLAAWTTGWVLTLGQAAFTASACYTFVLLVQSAVKAQYGILLTDVQRFGVLAAQLVAVGVLNCGSARLTAFMTTIGACWNLIALLALSMTLLMLAPERQSAKHAFTSWEPNMESTGISNPVYTSLVGLLASQLMFTGFDGSAHVAEETVDAEFNVPYAILGAISVSGASAYVFMLVLILVRMDGSIIFDPVAAMEGGNVVLQIITEVTKATQGRISSSVALFTIPITGTFFCSYQSVANNSRMLYAFARDHGVPFSRLGQMVQPGTQAPVCGVVYMLVLAAALSVPMCFNPFMFPVVLSFTVLTCYTAYVLPVLCKLSTGRRFFLPGPFYLGPWRSYINNVISAVWVLFIMVLFTLPTAYPVTLENCNWSGPILAGLLMLVVGWFYFPKYGAHSWFTGPRTTLGQFNDILPSQLQRRQLSRATQRQLNPGAAAGKAWDVVVAAATIASVPTPPDLSRGRASDDVEFDNQGPLDILVSHMADISSGRTSAVSRKSPTASYGEPEPCERGSTADGGGGRRLLSATLHSSGGGGGGDRNALTCLGRSVVLLQEPKSEAPGWLGVGQQQVGAMGTLPALQK